MVTSAREWAQKYESLKKQLQSRRISGQEFSPSEIEVINQTVEGLDVDLKTMGGNPLQYEIVASEIARRQILIENLRKQAISALGTGALSVKGTKQVGSSSSTFSPSTFNPLATTDKALVQRQNDMIKLQDEMLLDIEHGVDRLHGQAVAIGDEAKQSSHLLDDLDSNVEIATAALQAEAKHAAEIKDKAKVCWMYICIAVEVVIMLLLIIITVAA